MLNIIQNFLDKKQSKIVSLLGKIEGNFFIRSLKTALTKMSVLFLATSFLTALVMLIKKIPLKQEIVSLVKVLTSNYSVILFIVIVAYLFKEGVAVRSLLFSSLFFFIFQHIWLIKEPKMMYFGAYFTLLSFLCGFIMNKLISIIEQSVKKIIRFPMNGTLESLVAMIISPIIVVLSFVGLVHLHDTGWLTNLLSILTIDTPIMVFLIVFAEMLMWYLGLNGYGVLAPFVLFFAANNLNDNLFRLVQGLEPKYIFTINFWDYFLTMTGAGVVGALIILSLFSKKKGIRDLGKSSLVGSLFSLSEPMIFGVPIVMNKYFFIPFVVGTPLLGVAQWFVFHFGWVSKPTFFVADLPLPFSIFLATLDWKVLLMALGVLLLAVVIYLPSFCYYEKHYDEKKNENNYDDLDLDF